MAKLTTEQLVEKFRKTHGDLYDYSLVEYRGQNNKVKIVCKVHGMFEQRPGHHANGSGCQICYNERRHLSKRLTTDEFIQKCVEKFGDKYDYSQTVYLGNAKKITVVCKEHGPFEVLANDHLSKGTGCKKCKGRMVNTLEEFVEFCTNLHDGKYDYSKVVYKNTSTKVEIVCPIHGSFWQKPHSHRMGFGCDKCGGTYSLTTEEFIARSKEKFGDKFSYEKTVYVSMNSPVILSCKEYGEFEVKPAEHLVTSTGYSLEIRKTLPHYVIYPGSFSTRPEFVKQWEPKDLLHFLYRATLAHGDKYDYSKSQYKTKRTKITITCPVHGDFEMLPNNHYKGGGCRKCAATRSNLEEAVCKWFDSSLIERHNKSFCSELDIYFPDSKVAVECNGIYFHSDERKGEKTRHLNKTLRCLENGIKLFHFTDYEIYEKSEVVRSMINNSLGSSEKIYARKCEIVELRFAEYSEFFNKNHISGNTNAKVCYGLLHNGEIVSAMSFSLSRFSKEYEWEVIRFANKLNTSVVGAASRLFKHFAKSNKPNSVMSFADRRYGEGKVYLKLGMDYIRSTDVGYSYHHVKKPPVSRFKAQKHKLQKLLGDKFDPEKSEHENMRKSQYHRVYDCGHNVYAITFTH